MIRPALLAAGLLQSHLFNLVVFSALVSAVFATLLRDDTPSRLRFGLKAFGGFVLTTLALAWIMRPFPS
jgi:hypothetical protein